MPNVSYNFLFILATFLKPCLFHFDSTLFHQPLRGPVSGADHSFSHQYPQHNQFAYPGSNIPYVDYEEENPVPAMPIRQFPVCINNLKRKD